MKRIIKIPVLLLGYGWLAIMLLSLYQQYGNLFTRLEKNLSVCQTNQKNKVSDQQKIISKEQETTKENPDISAAKAENPDIRVLLCNDAYESSYHQNITITATVPFEKIVGNQKERYDTGELITFTYESLELNQGKVILRLEKDGFFQLPFLERAKSCPSYEGSLTIEKRTEGLLVVNRLPLETYLCYVLPSEMPSSYPLEAQKAQAVCARSYAMAQMNTSHCASFGADLDDSVSYQVYNNIGKTEEAALAVRETTGVCLLENDQPKEALYYSTSCGLRMEENASKEAVCCSILARKREEDCEKDEVWYRWKVYFPLKNLELAVKKQEKEIGNILKIQVSKRSANGRAEELQIFGTSGSFSLEGEYTIRQFLQPQDLELFLQDGTQAPSLGLLPSAFFYLIPQYEGEVLNGFLINGGGYGHGEGLSQNGAKHLAESKDYQEILKYYYGDGVEIKCITSSS